MSRYALFVNVRWREYPYLWLDATYSKARQVHHIVSMACVVATGVQQSGEREILGFAVGASEAASFWIDFLRSLKQRGLSGVRLATSDAQEGLKAAIAQVLSGASWQRCRVHWMRSILSRVGRADQSILAGAHWQAAAEMLEATEVEVLAYMAFPGDHWTRIYSTNPLEQLNKEIQRRTNVVGIFPDVASAELLIGAILLDAHDEWQVGHRYFS